jgi:HEPN domain-containing protein
MKKQVEDWILLADKDLEAAELIIEDEYLTNIVAFHCQQTIEKYFKAFLLENNKPIIKTHDLIKLIGIIKGIKDLGIDENTLIRINEVYVESRYPGDSGLLPDGIPTDEQAHVFMEYAKEIKTIILNELKQS